MKLSLLLLAATAGVLVAGPATAQGTLPAPMLVEPTDGSWRWVDGCIRWEAVPAANAYRLRVAPDSGTFGTPIIDLQTDGTFICSSIGTGLYKWQVSAYGDGVASGWSDIWRFEVRFPVSAQETPGVLRESPSLSLYPNPVRSSASILLNFPVAGAMELTVHDALGRKVGSLLRGEAAAGEQRTVWEPSGLAPGTYLMRLSTAWGVVTRVLVYAP